MVRWHLRRYKADGDAGQHHSILWRCPLLTVVLFFSFRLDQTARPSPFGMPGMVPPYVPPQMLNIPQTSLQAKPVVRLSLPFPSAAGLPSRGGGQLP